jgi:hypothetical protein
VFKSTSCLRNIQRSLDHQRFLNICSDLQHSRENIENIVSIRKKSKKLQISNTFQHPFDNPQGFLHSLWHIASAPCSLALSKHKAHERIYDKQFEAHIFDIGMQIDRFLSFSCFPSLSLSFFFEFQYYSICTQAEETLRKKERKIFFLFMRNVFLNYWHCVRLQVEETNRKLVKRTLERIPHSTFKLNCSISTF